MKPVQTIFERFSDVRTEYEICQQNRSKRVRQGVHAGVRKADHHYRSWAMLARAWETARDIDRNDMVVGQGISRFVNNVIQDGIPLSARTGIRELDAELEDRWRTEFYDDSISSTGELNGNQIEKLVCRSVVVDGDIVAAGLDDDTVGLFECHRLRTPSNATRKNMVHGILFDDRERPQEYWLTKEDINPMSALEYVNGPSGVNRIPARDPEGNRQVFHIFNPRRTTQHRGFTALAPIEMPIGLHGDIQLAKLVQQQVASLVALLEERDLKGKYVNRGARDKKQQTGEKREEDRADGSVEQIEGMAFGLRFTAQPGATLKGFSPNIPNAEFFEQAMMILQIIAINIDLPLIVFLLDATKSNFSAWRGAWDQAKIGLRAWQKLIASKLHCPIYRWKLRNWLRTDKSLAARVLAAKKDARAVGLSPSKTFNVFRHVWEPPSWPYIQPVEDASSNILRLHSLQAAPRDISMENGYDWIRDIIEPAIEDNESAWMAAIASARKINATLSAEEEDWKVSPMQALVLPLAERISFNISKQDLTNEPEQPEPAKPAGSNGRPKPENRLLGVSSE